MSTQLWPEASSQNAARSLRNHLYMLRQGIRAVGGDDGAVCADRQRIWWKPTPGWLTDLARIQAIDVDWDSATFGSGLSMLPHVQAATADLAGASQPLLSSWGDAWIVPHRLRWDTVLQRVNQRVLEAWMDRGVVEEIEASVARLLRFDPCDDAAHRCTLWVASRSGAQALEDQWQACRVAYRSELGARPSAGLHALFERLSQGSAVAPADVLRPEEPAPSDSLHAEALPSFAPVPPPTPPDPLVGREAELADIRRALRSGGLVTLLGTGGVGKTSLAAAFAAQSARTGRELRWVDLTGITEDAMVESAVADSLAVSAGNGLSTRDAVLHALASFSGTLVLDNCEHVVAGVRTLLHAMRLQGDSLRVLATSRDSLGLTGEQVVPIAPLRLPRADEEIPERVPAVFLFCSRCPSIESWASLRAVEREAVLSICRQLEGIPLALELAAARGIMLSPRQIAEQLRNLFSTLRGGGRDRPERHRTLWATIAWSWQLLDATERRLLSRLSVFRGGFDRASVDAVVDPTSAGDVTTTFAALVQRSMIVDEADMPTDDLPRYRLLEPIRAYCAAHLERQSRVELEKRHAAHFMRVAERGGRALIGHERVAWVQRLDRDRGNLRAAMKTTSDQGDAETALRLATALGNYWYSRGLNDWERHWLVQCMEKAPEEPSASLAGAWHAVGTLAYGHGRLADAEQAYRRSARAWEALPDHNVDHAAALNGLALSQAMRGALATAEATASDALALVLEVPDATEGIESLDVLSVVALRRGEYRTARTMAMRALEMQRDQDAPARSIFNTALSLSWAAQRMGELEEAAEWLAESLQVAEYMNSLPARCASYIGLAELALWRGALDRSRTLHRKALRLARENKAQADIAITLCNFGALEYAAGRLPIAVLLLDESHLAYEAAGWNHELVHVWIRRAWIQSENDEATPRRDAKPKLLDALERDHGPSERAEVHVALAGLSLAEGDLDAAIDRLCTGLLEQVRMEEGPPALRSIELAAHCLDAMGEPDVAESVIARASSLRDTMGTPRWPVEVARLESRMEIRPAHRDHPDDGPNHRPIAATPFEVEDWTELASHVVGMLRSEN